MAMPPEAPGEECAWERKGEGERERDIKADHGLGGGEKSEERAGRCPDWMPER